MKLITETYEDISVITEAKEGGGKSYRIEGIFMQGDTKNRNGRIYPNYILENEVNRYIKEYVDESRAVGELGHPQGPTINPDRISHLITEIRKDGSNWLGKARILESQPHGKMVRGLLDDGVKLGVSSRGIGSLKECDGVNEVQDDFMLSTVDIVMDPSAPDAFVQGILEGKEYVMEGGVIREIDVERIKEDLDRAARSVDKSKLEEAMLRNFEKFVGTLVS